MLRQPKVTSSGASGEVGPGSVVWDPDAPCGAGTALCVLVSMCRDRQTANEKGFSWIKGVSESEVGPNDHYVSSIEVGPQTSTRIAQEGIHPCSAECWMCTHDGRCGQDLLKSHEVLYHLYIHIHTHIYLNTHTHIYI